MPLPRRLVVALLALAVLAVTAVVGAAVTSYDVLDRLAPGRGAGADADADAGAGAGRSDEQGEMLDALPPDLRLVARFDLDEPPGATAFRDRVGGLVGRVGADVVTDGRRHSFPWVQPHSGVFAGHTDLVPPGPRLHRLANPGRASFAFTIRYRTRHRFGNLLQKGQGDTPGGYWKLENPERAPRCMFRGGDGSTRTGYLAGFEEGARLAPGWHVLTCVRTPGWVQMWVDGVAQPRAWGPTGTIRNDRPLSVGGKSACDAVRITCDYFSGEIDWIELRKG
ncbi:LamG domain-containing protein [Nocardioides solisilvae]|uniref:LamG domain-containing protein n=1 Tax=Nocardioides solisilvae TaxID=1542435 RepID=UPI0013A56F8C|nr:LamG domain-containing protein [Nocardioides solisilvae]